MFFRCVYILTVLFLYRFLQIVITISYMEVSRYGDSIK